MTLPLLDIISRYVSPSKATPKQWSSPCPFCGGDDRFVILPYESAHNGKEMPPHCFCRRCNAWVTAEMLLQQKEGIPWHEAHAIVEGSKSLDDVSQGNSKYAGKAKKLTPALVEGAPAQEWQWSAEWFYKVCKKVLWSEQGTKALQWLRDRGLSDEVIDGHDLGFNPQDYKADWSVGSKVFLHRGITIPYLGEDQVWKIEIRRSTNVKKERYRFVEGSSNALYGYAGLAFRGKAVMVEGVFDALCMEQALKEADIAGVAVVATGSTDGSKVSRWRMKLSLCDLVVVAFDSDEGGESAAEYWLHRLSDSRRWVPPCGDVNDTWINDKQGLIDACLSGFIPRKQCRVCALPSIDDDCYGRPWCAEHFPKMVENEAECELYCFECGEDLASFDCYGRAWCALHGPGEPLPVVEVKVEEQPAEPVQEAVSNSTNNISEEMSNQANTVSEILQPAVIVPAIPRKRKKKTKTSAMCSTESCEGIGRSFDMTGGQWCPNCKLRKELVDQLHALGFPRLEYSPTHFIESSEEAAKSFAQSMSGTAISLAVRAIARKAEKALI